ncbi:MAG: hypothetical protein MZV63_02445 [Marinilabiliales bacterium]|nr:hypothetical protein [Marinilabiliales bacterium]
MEKEQEMLSNAAEIKEALAAATAAALSGDDVSVLSLLRMARTSLCKNIRMAS